MMQKFNAVLLNAKGTAKWNIEGKAEEADEYNHIKPVLIDTDQIESVYPRADLNFGYEIHRIGLKSGDYFDVIESFEVIETILKKSRVVFN